MQRWQMRARRWESRAAERRSSRRGKRLRVAQNGDPSSLANDNEDLAATHLTGAVGSSGDATSASAHAVASDMVA